MNLQHPESTLNDLQPRQDRSLLQSRIGHRVDLETRCDLYKQGRLPFQGIEAGNDGLQESGQLRLQNVDIGECSQIDHARPQVIRQSDV